MSDSIRERIVFLTKVRTPLGKTAVRLLIDSLHAFGGEMGHCPFWLFEVDSENAPCEDLASQGVQVLPLAVPGTLKNYFMGDKVYACARAEELAPAGVQSLVWLDPLCLIVQPPWLYDLGGAFDAAVRPVHVQNVGLHPAEPLDAFWKKIYATAGVHNISSTVESFVDGQRLRAYFNSHAFAVNPAQGLLRRWFAGFEQLVCDQEFQTTACQDEAHQVYLFQAVLSATLSASLEPERIRVLPPDYNYPYNLQASIPLERRSGVFNDLVSLVYEDRSLDPNLMNDIAVHEPLRAWLHSHFEPLPR